jgi:DNA-binding NarL/FixJ family response regulator
MTRTRIILVDDHRLFRDGLRAILSGYADLAVVGEASDFREAVELVDHHESDLVILDITLPGSNGLALLRELKRRGQRQPVLILTMHQHADLVSDAFSAGATGYALKHQSEEELIEAVRTTAGRVTYLAPQLSRELLPDASLPAGTTASGAGNGHNHGILSLLSSREREIFDLIVRGNTNAAMAKQLFISIKTVETHRTRIMRKLDVHNVGELIRLAARHGLLAA